MSMLSRSCVVAAMALGVALAAAIPACQQALSAGDNPLITGDAVFTGPKADLPAAPAATIKAAFPGAAIRAAIANKDLGFPVYVVELAGDKTAASAEVTPDGTLVWSRLKLAQADLPAPVAKAASADGYTFASAEKVITDADCKFNGPKLAKLATPTTVYEVTLAGPILSFDGKSPDTPPAQFGTLNTGAPVFDGTSPDTPPSPQKSVITLSPDGTIINPLTPLIRASAIVPPGKFVLRVNCGSRIPYTDNSGITWAADQKYTAGKTTWGFIGQFDLTAQRTGLHVLGTDAPGVYDCERYKIGAYHFNVPNGTYTIRVHNNESWEGARTPASASGASRSTARPHWPPSTSPRKPASSNPSSTKSRTSRSPTANSSSSPTPSAPTTTSTPLSTPTKSSGSNASPVSAS